MCVWGGGGGQPTIDSAASMHNLHWTNQCTRRVSRNPFHCSLANTPGTDPVGAAPPRVGRRAGPLALGPERKPDRCLSRPHHQLEAIYHRGEGEKLSSVYGYTQRARKYTTGFDIRVHSYQRHFYSVIRGILHGGPLVYTRKVWHAMCTQLTWASINTLSLTKHGIHLLGYTSRKSDYVDSIPCSNPELNL